MSSTAGALRPDVAVQRPGIGTRVMEALGKYGVAVWTAAALIYLFLPIFFVVLFSLNDNKGRFNYTWQGFTLKHWKDPLGVPELGQAVLNSITIGLIATAIAVVLGTMMAMALVRHRFRGREATDTFVFTPLTAPEVILGSALLALFLTMNVATGYTTIVIAHIMFDISFVVVTVRARLEGMDSHLEEAAMDLGATPSRTFRRVTLPLIAPGIVAAALLAFALSFDDFVITNFNAGQTSTFPLFIWGAARQGVPPQVNVVATIMLVVVLVLMFGNLAWQRRKARADREAAEREETEAAAIAALGTAKG